MNLTSVSTSLRAVVFAAAAVALFAGGGQRRSGAIRHRQHQRAGRRLQRPDAGGAGRREHGHDARRAAADRVRACGAALERQARQQRPDPDSRAIRGAGCRACSGAPARSSVSRDFPNAPLPGTWYHVALANKLAGVDLIPANDDINANFSTNFNFYLGLDNNHGAAERSRDRSAARVRPRPRLQPAREPDHRRAVHRGLARPLQQQAARHVARLVLAADDERAAGGIRDAFRPRRVGRRACHVPACRACCRSEAPSSRSTRPRASRASTSSEPRPSGRRLAAPTSSANVVAAVDVVEATAGSTSTDGCSPFLNAGAVLGKIALVERGTCGFAVKAQERDGRRCGGGDHLQPAANVNAGPPGMAGDGINGAFVLIPTVSLRRADGLSIVAAARRPACRPTIGWTSPFAPAPMRRIAPGCSRRSPSPAARRSRTTTRSRGGTS